MLERMDDLPAGVEGLRAKGTVTRFDYLSIVEPMLRDARREGRRLRVLYELGEEFGGFTASAAWQDMKLGLRYLKSFDGCAVVSDIGWVRELAQGVGFLLPCPVRVFALNDRDEAVDWLAALPQGSALAHELLPDRGVLVVEVTRALRPEDFDSLAETADDRISRQGRLDGLVVHARSFPGWESLGSLIRHLEFVRNHHRRIRRVALAADSALAAIVPRLAEHFVEAEIRRFDFDALEEAIAWASGEDGTLRQPLRRTA